MVWTFWSDYTAICDIFFKINDLLHRARRQAVVDTKYLLR